MASLVVAAVVVTVGLSGCTTVPQSDGITMQVDGPFVERELDTDDKHEFCIGLVLEIARQIPDLTDESLPDAKDLYWSCMRNLGGAI